MNEIIEKLPDLNFCPYKNNRSTGTIPELRYTYLPFTQSLIVKLVNSRTSSPSFETYLTENYKPWKGLRILWSFGD